MKFLNMDKLQLKKFNEFVENITKEERLYSRY